MGEMLHFFQSIRSSLIKKGLNCDFFIENTWIKMNKKLNGVTNITFANSSETKRNLFSMVRESNGCTCTKDFLIIILKEVLDAPSDPF
jgi:hypothetical protein